MNVKLAAQVLSETVGKLLYEFGPPEANGTAKFCCMMDSFFDCLETPLNVLELSNHLNVYMNWLTMKDLVG